MNIISEGKAFGLGRRAEHLGDRNLEYALEMLGNIARDREGRKSICRQSAWHTVVHSALSQIQDSIMDAAAASADGKINSSLPVSATDSLRHALVLLCRM
jgi:hypothetical protein